MKKNTQFELMTQLAKGLQYGLIYIKEDGTIGGVSDFAKEIVGILLPEGKGHPAGRIEPGDIVIIADNDLGNDDKMSPKDLEVLGIRDRDIQRNDIVLAVGTYEDASKAPVYKDFGEFAPDRKVELVENYRGHRISTAIDFENHVMTITADADVCTFRYIESVGHAVVLDGTTGEVKFFQSKGYSYRGEELGELLRGKDYRGKNVPGEVKDILPTVGMKAKDIFAGGDFHAAVDRMMERPDETKTEGVFEIQQRMLFCTLIRVNKGTSEDGVYVLIQDDDLVESKRVTDESLLLEIESRSKRKMGSVDDSVLQGFNEYIGSSGAMMRIKRMAEKAAKGSFNVIITGESGTGKTRLAREIHNAFRPEAPFVTVACNAIAPSLIESELFGYVGGSFTGASAQGKSGYFEEANGGTIFLDEIGEIPPELQVKLLNVLQDKRIYRVGSTKPIDIDVRVIAATNRNLEEEVKKGTFRQDLFYRINVFPIEIPPLRERKNDLLVLANAILKRLCEEQNLEQRKLSRDAVDTIVGYDWPGNVRELENILERAVILSESKTIYSEHLLIPQNAEKCMTLKARMEQEEKKIIESVLIGCGGDKKAAMEELDVSRSVFYDKLKKYGLS